MSHRNYILSLWLFTCAALILILAMVGAATRLTESGLSITEWKPITGVLPPLNAQAWENAFALYKATPEYIQKNMGMTMGDFKSIFYWEWAHRLGGRLIGFFFLIPFIIFGMMGWVSLRLAFILLGILALGGLQGGIGWFMVQSGLEGHGVVSSYRLALHLMGAVALYISTLWVAFSLYHQSRLDIKCTFSPFSVTLYGHAWIAFFALMITMVWGAFVAGLDAGLIYNEFPTMGEGRIMPVEIFHQTPLWINFFENHAAVQFVHRWIAIFTGVVILSLVGRGLASSYPFKTLFWFLGGVVMAQIGLGIGTLLSNVSIYLAVMHQGGAFILVFAILAVLHRLGQR